MNNPRVPEAGSLASAPLERNLPVDETDAARRKAEAATSMSPEVPEETAENRPYPEHWGINE